MKRILSALLVLAVSGCTSDGEFDPAKALRIGDTALKVGVGAAVIAAETCTDLDRTKCARLAGVAGDTLQKVSILGAILNDSADLSETAASPPAEE